MLIEAGCDIRLPDTFQAHPAAALQPLLADVQGIYAGVDEFSAKVLASEEAAKLQIISRWGVGYDSIDVAAATELGIVITYTPGLLDDAVADYTFALLLGVARRIHTGHLSMHHGGKFIHTGINALDTGQQRLQGCGWMRLKCFW